MFLMSEVPLQQMGSAIGSAPGAAIDGFAESLRHGPKEPNLPLFPI